MGGYQLGAILSIGFLYKNTAQICQFRLAGLTGLSVEFLYNRLKEAKPASISFVTCLKKPSKINVDHLVNYIGFNISDSFVIGYGLDYAQGLIDKDENKIISLGGGTPCYNNNMDLILNTSNSESIYLKRPVDILVERLFKKLSSRPLISHLKNRNELKEFVSKHLFERNQYYLRSKKILNTNNLELDDVVEELKKLLG